MILVSSGRVQLLTPQLLNAEHCKLDLSSPTRMDTSPTHNSHLLLWPIVLGHRRVLSRVPRMSTMTRCHLLDYESRSPLACAVPQSGSLFDFLTLPILTVACHLTMMICFSTRMVQRGQRNQRAHLNNRKIHDESAPLMWFKMVRTRVHPNHDRRARRTQGKIIRRGKRRRRMRMR